MLTNQMTLRGDAITIGKVGAVIRVIQCDGNAVKLEVIAPASVKVRVVDNEDNKTCCHEALECPKSESS